MLHRALLSRSAVKRLHVAVVDARLKDYAVLLEQFDRANASFHFLPLGSEALRLARMHGADIWAVSVGLPDMSGLDLCAMLKNGCPESVVYVIADEYRAEDERAARACSANLFACKPVLPDWFQRYQEQSEAGCVKRAVQSYATRLAAKINKREGR